MLFPTVLTSHRTKLKLDQARVQLWWFLTRHSNVCQPFWTGYLSNSYVYMITVEQRLTGMHANLYIPLFIHCDTNRNMHKLICNWCHATLIPAWSAHSNIQCVWWFLHSNLICELHGLWHWFSSCDLQATRAPQTSFRWSMVCPWRTLAVWILEEFYGIQIAIQ